MNRNPIDTLKFDVDGKAFFLHHSTNPNLKVGEKIKTTGNFPQSTAGDALMGYSYGWDAMNPGARANAIFNQSQARNIYITSAEADRVFPDLNVLDSNARAIEGEQTILDLITFSGDETEEAIQSRILEKLQKLNIPLRTSEEEKLANLEMAISDRGKRAADRYLTASAETKLKEITGLITSGDFRYAEDHISTFVRDGKYIGKPELSESSLRGSAFRFGGEEGLRAQIIRDSGSLEAIARRPESVTKFKELYESAGKASGRELGTLSRRTLKGLLAAGKTAASVMSGKPVGLRMDDFV